MKNAYELAMERLAASDDEPVKKLTDAQRQQLADIDEKYKAKFAQREVFLKGKLAECEAKGDLQEADQIRKQIANEKLGLDEDRESEKDKVRNSS